MEERQSVGAATARPLGEALKRAPAVARRGLVEEFLRRHLSDALGLEPERVGARDNLMELGIDSLKAVDFKGFLESQLEVGFESSTLFDYPTIEALAPFLLAAAGLEESATASVGTRPVPERPVPGPAAEQSVQRAAASGGPEALTEEERLVRELAEELRAARVILGERE